MSHISKKRISAKTRKDIDDQFIKFVTKNMHSHAVLKELLTETEKIMLAKRLAAIMLLADEASYYRVCRLLGMSTSTLKRLHQQVIAEEFPIIEKLSHSKKNKKDFWEIVQTLNGILPPRGRGRWRRINRMLSESAR